MLARTSDAVRLPCRLSGTGSAASAGDVVSILGREDPLQKGRAALSSVLAWRVPVDKGAWWATVRGVTEELDITW